MTPVHRYIDKFKRVVLIDETHPLVALQDTLDAAKVRAKSKASPRPAPKDDSAADSAAVEPAWELDEA